jgi:hypothetical protein
MWTPVNIDPRNKNIDDWLGIKSLSNLVASKIDSDTYCNFNICVNGLGREIPKGYDRYILGFWFEIFDENIFVKTYNENPTAEFIVLTDLQPNDLAKFDRCKIINLFHWKWFVKQISIEPKIYKYKISSLSNRVNEYRAFVTLKLLDKKDVIVTWNARYMKDINVDYIFSQAGRPKRDNLIKNIDQLKLPINQEIFENDPQVSYNNGLHPAYAQTLVNSINETKDVCWHVDIGILPGPYLSEKTWKPLLYGNALLFTGQFNSCKTLSDLGFSFDYPWSNLYDSLPGDLDRLEIILDTIDEILGLSYSQIENGIKDSVAHNQNFMISKKIVNTIDQRNECGLDQLTKIL